MKSGCLSVEGLKYGLGSVTVGFICDKAGKEQLVFCPHFERIFFSRFSSLGVSRTWNKCCLDLGHCDFRGRRVRFKPHFNGTYTVVWVCPKLVGLPDRES